MATETSSFDSASRGSQPADLLGALGQLCTANLKQLQLDVIVPMHSMLSQALRRNPFAPEVPCHRVVKTNGSIGGFHGTQVISYRPIAHLAMGLQFLP